MGKSAERAALLAKQQAEEFEIQEQWYNRAIADWDAGALLAPMSMTAIALERYPGGATRLYHAAYLGYLHGVATRIQFPWPDDDTSLHNHIALIWNILALLREAGVIRLVTPAPNQSSDD